ncbi:MAG: hypothetical protein WCD80_04730, partial [Desulfobaccales bacterium]
EETLTSRFRILLKAEPCNLMNFSSGRAEPTYKGHDYLSIARRVGYIASLTSKCEFQFLKDILCEAIRDISNQIERYNIRNYDLLYLIENVIVLDYIDEKLRNELLSFAKESFYENANWITDVGYILDFFKLCPYKYKEDDQARIIDTINEIVEYRLDIDDPDLLSDELYNLEKIEKERGINLNGQLETLRDKLASAEENAETGKDLDYDDSYRGPSSRIQSISNEALVDMFLTLIN